MSADVSKALFKPARPPGNYPLDGGQTLRFGHAFPSWHKAEVVVARDYVWSKVKVGIRDCDGCPNVVYEESLEQDPRTMINTINSTIRCNLPRCGKMEFSMPPLAGRRAELIIVDDVANTYSGHKEMKRAVENNDLADGVFAGSW